MDLKALIAKMDHIESKKILNEGFPTVADAKARADKEKTTGKFDKKELSTGTQYTRKSSTFDDGGKDKDQKKAEKKSKNEGIEFQSSIAQALLREFGLEEADAANPWANDPAKSAAWAKLSPDDQKWLGGADPTDPYILARAPNKGKPVAAPAAAAPAAAAPTGVQAQGDDEGNTMITKPDGTVQVVGPDGKPLPNGGRVTPAAPATAQPPAGGAGGADAVAATRKRMTDLLNKLEKTGGVSGSAAAPAAAKPAAKPPVGGKPAAGGATMPAVDIMGNATGMTQESSDNYILSLIRSA